MHHASAAGCGEPTAQPVCHREGHEMTRPWVLLALTLLVLAGARSARWDGWQRCGCASSAQDLAGASGEPHVVDDRALKLARLLDDGEHVGWRVDDLEEPQVLRRNEALGLEARL